MAAIPFLSPINLNNLEIQNVRLQSAAASSTTATNLGGKIIYDSGLVKYSNGTNWITLRDSATPIVSDDITSLAWSKIDGRPTNIVNTLGGQSGTLTLKSDNTAIGTINLSMSTGKVLSAALKTNSSWQKSVTASDAVALTSITVNNMGLVTAVGSSDFYWANIKISKNQSTTTTPVFGNSIKIGGDNGVTLSFENGKLKIDKDVFSLGQVSAYGEGESGSSGGGSIGGLLDSWDKSYTTTDALAASLGVDLNTRLSNLESNGALSFVSSGSGNAVTGITKSGTSVVYTLGDFVETSALFDSNNKILTTKLPDFLLGQVLYGGTVGKNGTTVGYATLSTNAKAKLGTTSANITLTNNTTAKTGYKDNEGIYYICSADQTFAGIELKVGDWLISTGSGWQKIDNTDAVTGVKGNSETTYRIGNVNITKANIGLGNVENTTLSTWAGSANITTLGTIATGTWQGTAIADTYIASASTWNAKQNAINANNKLSWSYISSTPTTLSGYGITDAKIASGTITLGSNTITPLTASSTLDATKLSGTIPASCYTNTTYSAATNGGLSLSGTAFSIATATMTKINNGDTAYGAFGHSYSISGSTLTTYTTTTNFTTNNLVATLYDSSNNVVMADMSIVSSGSGTSIRYNVKVNFAVAIGSSTYRLVVIGI